MHGVIVNIVTCFHRRCIRAHHRAVGPVKTRNPTRALLGRWNKKSTNRQNIEGAESELYITSAAEE